MSQSQWTARRWCVECHDTPLHVDSGRSLGTVHARAPEPSQQGTHAMATDPFRTSANTADKIDRITRDLLAQLELQTQVVLNLLERGPEAEREMLLERLADLRGRLVRLRTETLGERKPELVRVSKND